MFVDRIYQVKQNTKFFIDENITLLYEKGFREASLRNIVRTAGVTTGADKIVVLKDGRVEEEGNPAALMQKEGIFPHMVKLQTEGKNWALQ